MLKNIFKFNKKIKLKYFNNNNNNTSYKLNKNKVVYCNRNKILKDVRNFIVPKSCIFNELIDKYQLKNFNDDVTMFNCCMFIKKFIKYKSDYDEEYWQYPEDTFSVGVANEPSAALLLKSLSLCAGISDCKVKVVVGSTKDRNYTFCSYFYNDTNLMIDLRNLNYELHSISDFKFQDLIDFNKILFYFNYDSSYSKSKIIYDKFIYNKIKNSIDK